MEKRNGSHLKPGVILLGGGLDSGALLYWLHVRKVPLEALWVDYGQKAAFGELSAVLGMCDRTGTKLHRVEIQLNDLSTCALLHGRKPNKKNSSRLNKLEARNVIFVGLAAMLAATNGLRCVYVGYHKEPIRAPFPDATPLARSMMSLLLGIACRPRIELVAPFEEKSRQEILALGLKLNPELHYQTFTCYEGELEAECGKCAHCKRKARMLKHVRHSS